MSNYILYTSESRGTADHGWLKSRHTFSFAQYFNQDRIHFGALRVLNDDIVSPGMGFGNHPHDNMEIISIPLKGSLEHKDSTGHREVIETGEVQIMSAGSGLSHSEYNHSKDESVNFLQIWIFPKEKNIKPRYDQRKFDFDSAKNRLVNVVAPDNEKALWINQDAWFSLGIFEKDVTVNYEVKKPGNGVYVFLIEGNALANGVSFSKRDGIGFPEGNKINLEFKEKSTVLVMDVPIELKN